MGGSGPGGSWMPVQGELGLPLPEQFAQPRSQMLPFPSVPVKATQGLGEAQAGGSQPFRTLRLVRVVILWHGS